MRAIKKPKSRKGTYSSRSLHDLGFACMTSNNPSVFNCINFNTAFLIKQEIHRNFSLGLVLYEQALMPKKEEIAFCSVF